MTVFSWSIYIHGTLKGMVAIEDLIFEITLFAYKPFLK